MGAILSWVYEAFFSYGPEDAICEFVKEIDISYTQHFNQTLLTTVTSITEGSALYPYIDKLVSSILWIQQGLTVITAIGVIVFALFFFHQVFKLVFSFMKALLNIQF